jgi:GTP cyclohydrolase I
MSKTQAPLNRADEKSPHLEDVQNRTDERQVPIDQVGVCDLRYPITVLDRNHEKQYTVARLTLSVSLPHHFKGTHMSRFIEVLDRHRGEVTMRTVPAILAELRTRLDAEKAQMMVEFPYFLERAAPVSGAKSLMEYDCSFRADVDDNFVDFVLGVQVPVTSLCPCSKAISDYGAHNQRGRLSMDVRTTPQPGGQPGFVWIEELIEIAEQSASAPVYPLLKREDERHLTMRAYDNPVFVEDMVRNVAVRLKTDARVAWFRVHAVNHESIHNHGAFAQIEWRRASEVTG